jgi:hypothetical protein
MVSDVMIGQRLGPQVIGMGLIETIPESEIPANARDQAAAGGAICGMPNRVCDAIAQKTVTGRLGWKANTGSVALQSGGAFNSDMGIGLSAFWRGACTAAQKDCLVALHGGEKRSRANGIVPSGQATAKPRPSNPRSTRAPSPRWFSTPPGWHRLRAASPKTRPGVARPGAVCTGAGRHLQPATCHRPSAIGHRPPAELHTWGPMFQRRSAPKISGQRIWP